MGLYDDALAQSGLTAGQVLLAPRDFMIRQQYLYARGTLERLLELGVVPVINENDAIADDEIRFGDNDRLSALVAHLLGADLLVLLTDTPGLLTADPRLDQSASLIEEIVEVDQEIEALAGATGSGRGSGGMASKVTAAKIAAWSGVRAVIADARRPGVMAGAVAGEAVGTVVQPREKRLASRKLWIAFAVGASGTVVVDAGARRALVEEPQVAAARRDRVGRAARSTPTTPSRSPDPTARSSPRAWSGSTLDASRPPPASRPATSRTAPPTRSSTATTSWSCPEGHWIARSGSLPPLAAPVTEEGRQGAGGDRPS